MWTDTTRAKHARKGLRGVVRLMASGGVSRPRRPGFRAAGKVRRGETIHGDDQLHRKSKPQILTLGLV
jgi:hypothetical protein